MNLAECIPKDKFDLVAVARARNAGFPALNPILYSLMEWTRDYNWPVARDLFKLLTEAGPEIVPHIRSAFDSEDSTWKYWLLTVLCPNLSPSILNELANDIVRLATEPTKEDRAEEVDIVAAGLTKSR